MKKVLQLLIAFLIIQNMAIQPSIKAQTTHPIAVNDINFLIQQAAQHNKTQNDSAKFYLDQLLEIAPQVRASHQGYAFYTELDRYYAIKDLHAKKKASNK